MNYFRAPLHRRLTELLVTALMFPVALLVIPAEYVYRRFRPELERAYPKVCIGCSNTLPPGSRIGLCGGCET